MKLSRRSFLHTGLCGAGALWLASSRLSQAAVQFKMSACDWSLGVSCDPSGLDLALSLGLDGLEISAADGAADQLKIGSFLPAAVQRGYGTDRAFRIFCGDGSFE